MKAKIFAAMIALFILLPSMILAQGGWITIPASAFTCRSSIGDWAIADSPEHLLHLTSADDTQFMAPVIFPPEAQGQKVTELNATVLDYNAQSSVVVALYRVNRYGGTSQKVFEKSTSPPSNGPGKTRLIDRTGSYRLIDNEKYAWFISFKLSSLTFYQNLGLYSVRIKYQ